MRLIATSRPACLSVACQTIPKPPSPNNWETMKRSFNSVPTLTSFWHSAPLENMDLEITTFPGTKPSLPDPGKGAVRVISRNSIGIYR